MGERQKIPLSFVFIIALGQLGWTLGEENFQNLAHPHIHELKTLLYRSSTYQLLCTDECSYDESDLYYRCNTDKGRDYCSPTPDVTYKNEPCQSDHSCDTHGSSYTWCRTDSGWDYCGKTIERYRIIGRQKRAPTRYLVHTESNNNMKIMFYIDLNGRHIARSGWAREIENGLISLWSNNCLRSQAKCNRELKEICIDQVGQVQTNNKQYYDLQIQLYPICSKFSKFTVAQVLLEDSEYILDSHTQRAFKESLERRATIAVEVQR